MTYLVAVGISAAVGYFVVVGAVWQLFDWLDEARSISSLFWPISVPVVLGIRLARRLTRQPKLPKAQVKP